MKCVNIKKIIILTLFLFNSNNLLSDEKLIRLSKTYFKKFDVENTFKVLPGRPSPDEVKNKINIDKDNDGVDDFIEHLLKDFKIKDEALMQSVFEYFQIVMNLVDSCKEKDSYNCYMMKKIKSLYLYRGCRKFETSKALEYLNKRLRLNTNYLDIFKNIDNDKNKKFRKNFRAEINKNRKVITDIRACSKIE